MISWANSTLQCSQQEPKGVWLSPTMVHRSWVYMWLLLLWTTPTPVCIHTLCYKSHCNALPQISCKSPVATPNRALALLSDTNQLSKAYPGWTRRRTIHRKTCTAKSLPCYLPLLLKAHCLIEPWFSLLSSLLLLNLIFHPSKGNSSRPMWYAHRYCILWVLWSGRNC